MLIEGETAEQLGLRIRAGAAALLREMGSYEWKAPTPGTAQRVPKTGRVELKVTLHGTEVPPEWGEKMVEKVRDELRMRFGEDTEVELWGG